MRSLSQPRSDLSLQEKQQNNSVEASKEVISPQSNLKQRPTSKAYAYNSVIARDTRDMLRTENDDPRYPVRNSYIISSTHESPNMRHYRIDTQAPQSWQDMISYQGNTANYLEQRNYQENRMRAMKYKENLDKMIREERMRKVEDKNEMINQSKQNYREIEALMRAEKMKEQEEKKQYSDHLQKVINLKNSFNIRDLHQRYQSETELNKTIAQLKAYERYLASNEGRNNKMSFEEYKRKVEQDYFGYNNKEDRQYRETLFKPEQVWNRPNPGFQDRYMDPDKRQQLDDYINRSAVKKQEQETFEIIKKKEATKKLQADVLMKVQIQLQEKARRTQEENEQKKQEFRYQKENKRMLEQIADVQKLQQMHQKKNYGELLKNQMCEKKDWKHNSISLTPAEKVMNFRRQLPDPILKENVMTVFPNSVTAHDRSVQLKYLDRWLEK